jgi:integrase
VQTIKAMIDGKAVYRKPKKEEGGYHPIRNSRNVWFFHNRQDLICKQVWEIGQKYYERMQDPERKPHHRVKYPALLVKVFYWIFLTGARQQEAFQQPNSLDISTVDGKTYVTIKRHNEKHRAHGGDEITAVIPVFDEWEQNMWNFITDGGQETQMVHILNLKLWGSIKKDNITLLFKHNFKTSLQEPKGTIHHDEGITPHILRHMRCYNVLHDHNLRRSTAQIWFGWDNQLMLDYYAHIRAVTTTKDQLKALVEDGQLTELRIDASKAFTSGG